MVKDGLANKPINPSVAAMRVFTQEHLNLPKGSNVVLLAVEHSKSFRAPGGNSTSAVIELVNKLLDFKAFRTLDSTAPGTVTIAPMYRAQVNGYIKAMQGDGKIDESRVKVRDKYYLRHFPVIVSCTCRRFLSSPSAYNAVVISLLLTTQRTYKPFP
jgi:hypothetical protein